ncbi:hypothetical protein JJB27_03645 [Campylobacter fetus subsp. venerealis]|uniref:hypothetical protein n=1 Tax=Campylobacter fetus TaxID=196 RepID=UPI000818814A|nr:hypothetical protein [Campylobacter fetus]MBK3498170.1 hypothetical protein [Campylobacter fetus subsp. venerealis]MBK3502198.1 hypothetical protein [Campylobacter fetus subsp. venerealis]OCS16806.1 hypothetical protein CfvWBT01109_01860 [Campylobacter fetus subsp. venerealis]
MEDENRILPRIEIINEFRKVCVESLENTERDSQAYGLAVLIEMTGDMIMENYKILRQIANYLNLKDEFISEKEREKDAI